jgi:K+-transporting ATPase ATPase C chain
MASAGHFHGRPAATTGKALPAPYNAANSGGSNLPWPGSDIEKLRPENPSAQVPNDLLSISGSRFDAHPTPEAALFQGPRVARARSLPDIRVRQLAAANTSDRFAGLFGKRVNALEIKLALHRMAARFEHASMASTLFLWSYRLLWSHRRLVPAAVPCLLPVPACPA